MRETILKELKRIEETEHVKILFAVESGSRAWGFESEDSDYDVRFVYVRKLEDYLRLDYVRDVIERPVDDVLDINGWDLQKALRLLYRSNPTLLEWLSSPIVYMDSEAAETLRNLAKNYFSKKKSVYHYLSMAEANYKTYLSQEAVKAKKYFYVLRPVLASYWIKETGTPPPMRFEELMERELPEELTDTVNKLLVLKRSSKEVEEIPPIPVLHSYFDASFSELREYAEGVEETRNSWKELNAFFQTNVGFR